MNSPENATILKLFHVSFFQIVDTKMRDPVKYFYLANALSNDWFMQF